MPLLVIFFILACTYGKAVSAILLYLLNNMQQQYTETVLWYRKVAWGPFINLVVLPFFGLISIFWVKLEWKTAAFSSIYLVGILLCVTAGKCETPNLVWLASISIWNSEHWHQVIIGYGPTDRILQQHRSEWHLRSSAPLPCKVLSGGGLVNIVRITASPTLLKIHIILTRGSFMPISCG